MKKTTKLVSMTLGVLSIINLIPTVASATTTDGLASFEVDSNAVVDPIKPGTEDPIVPEKPITPENVSNIHLIHVPDFNFGLNKTSLVTKNYGVKYSAYTKNGVSYEIPQFVQVADLSGKEGTKWSVMVQQEAPFKSTDASQHVLTNSRIIFHGSSVTNNVNEMNAENMLNPVTVTSILPVKGEDGGALEVFSSKAGVGLNTTNGTISSMIFKNNYDEADYGMTIADPDVNNRNTNSDVVLKLEQSDKVQVKNYQADLVWTLTVTP